MTVRRLVVPEGALTEPTVVLEGEVAGYLRDVLRLPIGARLLLLDGAGWEAFAEIKASTRRSVELRREDLRRALAPEGLDLTLIQAVGKGDKVDLVVRQATELGARRIIPVLTERVVGEKRSRLERWRAIAEDAVRVSGRAYRPVIEPVAHFTDVLARPRAPLALALALGAERSLGAALDATSAVPGAAEILIGPEGGLSSVESEQARRAGFSAVHLGPYVLRTETAGPAVAALMLFWSKSLAR